MSDTTYPHSSWNSAVTRAQSHGVDIASLAAACPVEQGREYCAVCCAVCTDDPAPIPAAVPSEYILSGVRTLHYPATGRAISHIYVLRNTPGWPGGRTVSMADAQSGNRLYAYRWNCDSRWTVVDSADVTNLTTLVDSEEQAREMLTAGLKARGLI